MRLRLGPESLAGSESDQAGLGSGSARGHGHGHWQAGRARKTHNLQVPTGNLKAAVTPTKTARLGNLNFKLQVKF
eukprot:1560331-Rhodomonas_salina.1